MHMVSLLSSRFYLLLNKISISAWSTTSHLFLSWLPFINFWGMDQENSLHLSPNSKVLWMVKKSQPSMSPIKHGTVSLDKLLQHTKNVKPILLDFTYHFLKMFRKFFCPNTPSKRDGTSSLSNGMIWLLVVSRDLFTLTLMEKNGYKLMSAPLMLF